jgi:hypothetical protein
MAEQTLQEFRANLAVGTKISWIDTDDKKYQHQALKGIDSINRNLSGVVHPGTIREIREYPNGLKVFDITDDRTGGPLTVTINEILKPLTGGRKSRKRGHKRRMTRRK